MIMEIRWRLWEWAWLAAYLLCPDKKALACILMHGTVGSRASLKAAREQQ